MSDEHDIVGSIIEEEDTGGWIVTYADMVTLLLSFFVLLYAISTTDIKRFKIAMKSIQINLGETEPAVHLLKMMESSPGSGDNMKLSVERFDAVESREKELLQEIESVLKEETIGENIVVQSSEGRIGILIKGKVLFEPGEAVMNMEAIPILGKITSIIDGYPEYLINIKGYTDNMPIATEKFPSNWELSAVRATTVLKYLIEEGISPKRLTATGYGELLPIAPNDTEDNRAKNRRVEFVLEKKKN